ncbi:Uncharacterized protein Fot_09085 [Forsythia ovata]|uniref:Uncharacterized protein n=1 Tax=Forsythia ovata TaxID=205694 RepID=A0ABD1WDJ6_9LAMI
MKTIENFAPNDNGLDRAGSSEVRPNLAHDAVKDSNVANHTCRDVWTEYHDMGFGGIKAVAEYKAYTVGDILDLLQFVAPKMMERGSAHFSYGEERIQFVVDEFDLWASSVESLS